MKAFTGYMMQAIAGISCALLFLAASACVHHSDRNALHRPVVRENGRHIEFLLVEVNHSIHSAFVRGDGVVPYASDGITRNAWAEQFERMAEEPGRWQNARICGDRIRFTSGYIGNATHRFARVLKLQGGIYSVQLIEDEHEDIFANERDE